MNLLLYIDAVKSQFVYFTETKPNILFNGTFTKINYCNDFFTMYGMHIYANNVNLETISKIESDILNVYSQYVNKPVIKNMKLASDTKLVLGAQLKISGVWENETGEVGLLYKIV